MKKSSKGISPIKGDLTIEKLKTYKGFENSTEEVAAKEIEAIKRLAKIMYYLYMADLRKEKANNEK